MWSAHIELGSLVEYRLISSGVGYHPSLNHRVTAIKGDYFISGACILQDGRTRVIAMITTLGSVDPYLSPVELEGHIIPLRQSVQRSCPGFQRHTLPSVLVMVCLKYL